MIAECIQGEGGVNEVRAGWLQRLRSLADEHGVLLIIDDIQAGCGRSGTFFSFEPSGNKPDIITLSKSISGFGSPMSLVLLRSERYPRNPLSTMVTFRGNNHAFVTAEQAIASYWSDDSLMQDVARKAAIIRRTSRTAGGCTPELGLSIRGRGFLPGLVFADPQRAAMASRRHLLAVIIIERAGRDDEVVKFMPAPDYRR